jgi:3-vinyl bacteriochlorophyllide hydratase
VHRQTAGNPGFEPFGESSPHSPLVPRSPSHHRTGVLSNSLYSDARETFAAPANKIASGTPQPVEVRSQRQSVKLLYTPEQRLRRDATKWTLVQGVLAPIQFLVFLISLGLVLRYLTSGDGFGIAATSIVIKTLLLYAIMITGSIWEREVFGVYLFAPAFFWEDVFSFLVLALHTAYLVALFCGLGDGRQQMLLALAAYASYFVNATQFILKLRAARRDERIALSAVPNLPGSAA